MDRLDINSLPKIKDSKEKIKKTFLLTPESVEVYEKAKVLKGIDTTKLCTDAVEKTLQSIKHLLNEK